MKIQDSKGRIHIVPKKYEDEIRHYIKSNNHSAVDTHIQKYGWGGVVDGIKNFGLGVLDSGLSTINPDIIKDSAYSDNAAGRTFRDIAGVTGGIMHTATPIAASAFGGPAAGMAVSGLQQSSNMFIQPDTHMRNKNIKTPIYSNPVLPFENGGPVNNYSNFLQSKNNLTLINVESDELEVDPIGNIVKDFKNKPPHPISGINPNGNIMAREGNIIIPKKLRNKYLYGDRQTRQSILKNLSFLNTGTTKMYGGTIKKFEEGGINDPYNPYEGLGITWGSKADPTGTGGWTYDAGISNDGNQIIWTGFSPKGKSFKMTNPSVINALNTAYPHPWETAPRDPNATMPSYTGSKYNAFRPNTNLNLNPSLQKPQPWGGGYSGQTKSYMNPINIPNTGIGIDSANPNPKYKLPINPNVISNNIIPYTGDIAQMTYNIFSKPEYPDRMKNKEYNRAIQLMQNRRYDISGQLRSNREGLGAFNYAAKNASGGNAGMYLNQMSVGRTNFDNANANAWAQKNNMDNQYMAEEAQLRSTLGAQDTAYGYQHQDDKLMAEATRRNNIFAPMQNMGSTYLQLKALKNQKKMLEKMYPDYYNYIT